MMNINEEELLKHQTSEAIVPPEDVVSTLDANEAPLTPVMELEFRCCICNQPIHADHLFTVVLVWPAGEDVEDIEQTWWAHRGCFVQMLHPLYRYMRDEEPTQ